MTCSISASLSAPKEQQRRKCALEIETNSFFSRSLDFSRNQLHDGQPFGSYQLPFVGIGFLKEAAYLLFQSADSPLVSPVVSSDGAHRFCSIFVIVIAQLFSFRSSWAVVDPFEGALRELIQCSLLHGKVDFLRKAMDCSFASSLLPVDLLGLVRRRQPFVLFYCMTTQGLPFRKSGLAVVAFISFFNFS